MPDEEDKLSVYVVTGNDSWDDPAWGMEPIFTGDAAATRRWLAALSGTKHLSVMRGGRAVWASEFLDGASLTNDHRSGQGGN